MLIDATSSLLATLLPLAAGRGDNPDEGSGVLLIVLVILAAIVVVGGILTIVARRTRG